MLKMKLVVKKIHCRVSGDCDTQLKSTATSCGTDWCSGREEDSKFSLVKWEFVICKRNSLTRHSQGAVLFLKKHK